MTQSGSKWMQVGSGSWLYGKTNAPGEPKEGIREKHPAMPGLRYQGSGLELAARQLSVDVAKCTGCGLCAKACPTKALDIIDRKAVLGRDEDCMGCQLCEVECPFEAISVQRPILRLSRKGVPTT